MRFEKINLLHGATIVITAMLVITPAMLTSHLAKASSRSSSASAGSVPSQRAFAGKALVQQPPVRSDQGCSSGSVAVGGTNGDTSCFAANIGQSQLAQNALVGGPA
jgi:hypothetical protein